MAVLDLDPERHTMTRKGIPAVTAGELIKTLKDMPADQPLCDTAGRSLRAITADGAMAFWGDDPRLGKTWTP